jgi:hypothetical protein
MINIEGDAVIWRDITRHSMKDRELIREIAVRQDLALLGAQFSDRLLNPCKEIHALTNQHDSDIYRIHIRDTGEDRISVICVGMERVDACLEGAYDNLQELPQWVQERIAVLSMLNAKPPTQNIEGVGRRINESTYWVYRPSSC